MYIYFYYGEENTTLYIGSSKDVLSRFYQHKASDSWMELVRSVTVKGPFERNVALEIERFYIAKEKPTFNSQNLFSVGSFENFPDNVREFHFNSIEEFEKFYVAQPDGTQRASYYLKKVDVEALNILKYYTGKDLTIIVPEIIEAGIRSLITDEGYEKLYIESYKRVVHLDAWKERGLKNFSDPFTIKIN